MLSRTKSFLSHHGGTLALVVLVVASLSLNVVMARQLGWGATPKDPIGAIKLETVMPSVRATSLEGKKVEVSFGGNKPVLLYVMSPTCGWCNRNYNNILTLANAVKNKYRIVGLSTNGTVDELRTHLNTKPLPFEVSIIDKDQIGSLPFAVMTPTTVAVVDGRIRAAWVGAIDEPKVKSLRKFFVMPTLGVSSVISPQ